MLHPSMNQDVFRKVHPHEYLKRFLSSDVRPDGRAPSTPRKISITTGSVGTAVGSALLKIGQTTVVAGVHATLVQPSPAAPDQGFLETFVELPSLASGNYKSGRPSDEATCLTEYLRDLIAPHLDLAQLCVEEGQLVWHLRLTVYCVDSDGNLEDAVLLAAVAAFQDVRLPAVRVLEEDEDAMDSELNSSGKLAGKKVAGTESESIIAVAAPERTMPLEFDGFPLSVSFALFDDTPLIDPSAEEEAICNARLTFLLRPSGDLRGVIKPGGRTVPESMYNACLAQAKLRVPTILSTFSQP